MSQLNWGEISQLISSETKLEILDCLSQNELSPSLISKKTSLNISTISKNLKLLEELDLIVCLTPNNRKGKLFQITNKGKTILSKVNKLKNGTT